VEQPKTPVIYSPAEFVDYLQTRPDKWIMGYFGEKTEEGWAASTSRRHMNRIWDEVVYLPLNVADGDEQVLNEYYDLARSYPQVLGFNHTNPHKSNAVMRARFGPGEGDVLIRTGDSFAIRDCNGQAAVELLHKLLQADSLTGVQLAVVGGLGASGRLIALAAAKEAPARLIIVDIVDNPAFLADLARLCPTVQMVRGLENLPALGGRVALVNATRHQNARTGISILPLVQSYDQPQNAFLDLLMGTGDEEKVLKMPHADGHEYVVYTNYRLSQLIETAAGNLRQVSFAEFERIVAL
jgi:shikimate 5-dehydrogenase